MTNNSPEITQYLQDWRNGNASALEDVLPFVYNELRLIAKRYRSKENNGHTLQTTEIINEAYLKLIDQSGTDGKDGQRTMPGHALQNAAGRPHTGIRQARQREQRY